VPRPTPPPTPDAVLGPAVTRCRHHFAHRHNADDPADADQDLVLALLQALSNYRPERGPLEAYLYGVLRRRHVQRRRDADRARRRDRQLRDHRRHDPDHGRDDDPGGREADRVDLRLDAADIRRGLDPDLARLADALAVLPLAEVARDRGVPRTTLRRRVDALKDAYAALAGPP
jgi:DNA-directed RNA polymerase specialized sigma24 family protein